MKTKKCRGSCGEAKPLDAFSKNRTCKGGFEATCKDCKYEARGLKPRFSTYNMLTESMKETIMQFYAGGMDSHGIVQNFHGRRAVIRKAVVDEVIKRHSPKLAAIVFPNRSGLSV